MTDRLIEERDALERRLQQVNHQLQAQELTNELLQCPGRGGLPHDWMTTAYEQRLERPRSYGYLGSSRYDLLPSYMRSTSTEVKCHCVRCPATMVLTQGSRY